MPLWLLADEGGVIERSYDAKAVIAALPAAGPDSFVIVTPPALTMIRSFDLPDLTPKQAQEAARRMAIDESLGAPDALHVAVSGPEPKDGSRYHAVSIATAELEKILDTARQRGLDPDHIVPAGLLLPEPAEDEGFVRASFGPSRCARGYGLVLPGREALADAVIGEAPVTSWTMAQAETALLAAIADVPGDLRSGTYALQRDVTGGRRWLVRMGFLVLGVAIASLLTDVAQIIRFHRAAHRLDARTLAVTQPFVGHSDDARAAEDRLNALMVAKGAGTGSFTGLMSLIGQAKEPLPGVAIRQLDRGPNGEMRIMLTSRSAEDIESVSAALRVYGLRVEQDPATSGPDGSHSALMVVAP